MKTNKIFKSEGVTPTEKMLAEICDRTFLKLWSYPNPFKDDKKELCDLLAVFENHVLIFFDRENLTFSKENNDLLVSWNRWKKRTIDSQIKTANGAERYLRSEGKIFLDNELSIPFPFEIDRKEMVVHKIIVAHGAKAACEKFSEENLSGSIGICYGDNVHELQYPFLLQIDKANPVHVFDSYNLPIILSELDTFYDFTTYLEAKIEAIESFDMLSYCGEEDLLANYYLNFDKTRNKHFIGTIDKKFNFITIGEGEWKNFIELEIYKRKKIADKDSYLWDRLIQKTCEHTLEGTIRGFSPLNGKSAVHEMAKEPRFHRRELSKRILNAIDNFPETPYPMIRNITFMNSFLENKGYVFLQLKMDGIKDYENEYRPIRQEMLRVACGAAKNNFENLKTVVGLAIDAPKYAVTNSEDFILMDCTDWSDEQREQYRKENEIFGFFKTGVVETKNVTEFPSFETSEIIKVEKVGRNTPCLCGSGRKYKNCCFR